MDQYYHGKGAQVNPKNVYSKTELVTEHIEGLDEPLVEAQIKIEEFFESPVKILNRVDSPDIPYNYSINPYQGCEHGCVYCYARDTHQFWGFSSGLDFESKIIVKRKIAQLLEKEFLSGSWKPQPVMLSGNTDCYQPLERKHGITRSLLEVFNKFQNPVGIITKNSLIKRDIDLLTELSSNRLVKVMFSITTLDEDLRRKMEPRTASVSAKFDTITELTKAGIPVGVMIAPVIPGINHHEIPEIIKRAGDAGVTLAAFTVVRLNGNISKIFKDWLLKNFPDRVHKVWHLVQAMHNGQVSDTEWTRRMIGSGNIANSIQQLFEVSRKKYLVENPVEFNLDSFRKKGNYRLF